MFFGILVAIVGVETEYNKELSMYNKAAFTGFTQPGLSGGLSKNVQGRNRANESEERGFNSFMRKYQEKDFNFSREKVSKDKKEDVPEIESREDLLAYIVGRIQEILRNSSDSSTFVEFKAEDVENLKSALVSAGGLSDYDIEDFASSINKGKGDYLSGLLKGLKNFESEEVKMEDVFFPTSFVPYFETALESIGFSADEAKNSVEGALDIENGFSLGKFLNQLAVMKAKKEESLLNLEGEEFEKASSIINGIDTITSVFSPSEEKQEDVFFDKKSLESLLSSLEGKLAEKNGSKTDILEVLRNSADKDQAAFVAKLLEGHVEEASLENGLAGWKRRERLLSELNLKLNEEKIETDFFKNSNEYNLFTKLSSVELDFKNYFSGGDSNENLEGLKALANLKEGIKKEDLPDLKDDGVESLLEKGMKKNMGLDFQREIQNVSESETKSESSSMAQKARESRAALHKHVMNQVEKQVLRTVKLGERDISFRLNPPDLGKMHLKLENVRNGVNIKIIAEKSSTHEILIQQAQDFKAQMESQGMQVAEVNVELAHDFDQAMARERRNGFNNSKKSKNGNWGRISGDSKKQESSVLSRRSKSSSGLDLRA